MSVEAVIERGGNWKKASVLTAWNKVAAVPHRVAAFRDVAELRAAQEKRH